MLFLCSSVFRWHNTNGSATELTTSLTASHTAHDTHLRSGLTNTKGKDSHIAWYLVRVSFDHQVVHATIGRKDLGLNSADMTTGRITSLLKNTRRNNVYKVYMCAAICKRMEARGVSSKQQHNTYAKHTHTTCRRLLTLLLPASLPGRSSMVSGLNQSPNFPEANQTHR